MMFLTSIFIFTTFPLTCVICDKKISVKSTVNSELNLGTSLLCERYTLYLSLNDPFRFVLESTPCFRAQLPLKPPLEVTLELVYVRTKTYQ